MTVREATVLVVMCIIWGMHVVVIKIAVAELPPLLYAAIRMTLVAVLLSPLLRWRAGLMKPVLLAGMCLGALNYAFLFSGLTRAPTTAAAITLELYAPFATILSALFLGEHVGWRRASGVAFAFAGVALVAFGGASATTTSPLGASAMLIGVGLVGASVFSEAVGTISVKKALGFKPFELLAWFSVIGVVVLWPATLVFETNHVARLASADKTILIGAVLYSALGSSLIAHSSYYWLLQRLPVSQIAPSIMLATIIAIIGGVVFLGERLNGWMVIGALTTLSAVGFILLRNAKQNTATQGRQLENASIGDRAISDRAISDRAIGDTGLGESELKSGAV
ncbi:MAG: EamA family transporter [Pseudomonadota bacterium]